LTTGNISRIVYTQRSSYGENITDIKDIAEMLLFPHDKSPYRLGGPPIRNFQELRDNMDMLPEYEATWVADWVEYLGDAEAASNIYERPERFRAIIRDRYRELNKALSNARPLNF
jgi:hypothetical protein